jgi:hypothetical protein
MKFPWNTDFQISHVLQVFIQQSMQSFQIILCFFIIV